MLYTNSDKNKKNNNQEPDTLMIVMLVVLIICTLISLYSRMQIKQALEKVENYTSEADYTIEIRDLVSPIQ